MQSETEPPDLIQYRPVGAKVEAAIHSNAASFLSANPSARGGEWHHSTVRNLLARGG